MPEDSSPSGLVITEDLLTAEALIGALRPTDARWAGQSLRWVFRGHADSDWALLPTAYRRNAWRAFRPEYDPEGATSAVRNQTEWEILRDFGDRLDRAGLPIPGETREDLDRQDPQKLERSWLMAHIELAALAQHHGVPTRLLDFTRSGLAAAYFAGLEPPNGPAPVQCCVWAIDGSFFTLGYSYEERSGGLALVRGSRALNPNQHAQDGLMGLWAMPEHLSQGRGAMTLTDVMELISEAAAHRMKTNVSSPAETTIWREIMTRLAKREPFARKLTLPRSEAPALIRLLANERITAATMFPGVGGVVASMREARRYGVEEHDLWRV
jgi:hypothetical protein